MKKLFLISLMVFVCGIAKADEFNLIDSLKKVPAIKQGVAYSIQDSRFNYMATMNVASWKGINLEAGYAGVAKDTANKVVAVLSYDLLKVKDVINLPILDLVSFRPGIYAGYGRIESFQDGKLKGEGDFGLSLSVIDVKF